MILATIIAWIGWVVGVIGIGMCAVLVCRAVRQVRSGYQDRNGFHYADRGRLPQYFTRHRQSPE